MKEMEKSITLIGLPGCGKTTVGNLLSDKLNYEFIDMDFYIEDNQGKTIIELFKNGEDYFRNIETETCKELGERSKTIISSGGGVVKKRKLYDERYDLYKEYCDYRVENTGSLEEVVNKIAKVVNR